MCINPMMLADGTLVRCRNCWQCRSRYADDWAGRCIAESKTAKACNFVTLTYGTDMYGERLHERAVVLTYSDVQKYIKRLRRNGYPCRYFAVGEYGSLKGRAHWHLILFWQDKVPPHKINRRMHEDHWPHGYSQWEDVSYANVRYCAKYMRKDSEPGKQAHFAMSKKPPLGAAYFARLAAQYVMQGLAPQDLTYTHGEVQGKGGKLKRFTLFGRSAELYMEAYVAEWKRVRGGHFPESELLDEYLNKKERFESDLIEEKPYLHNYYPSYLPATDDGAAKYSSMHKAWYVSRNGRRLWWSYTEEGDRAWQEKVKTQADGTWRRLRVLCAAGSGAQANLNGC